MNTKSVKPFWGFIFIIFGFIITFQLKAVKEEKVIVDSQKNLSNLQQLFRQENIKCENLKSQVKLYEKIVEDYELKLLTDNEKKILKPRLERNKFWAGVTDVSGEGIIITLDDSKESYNKLLSPKNLTDTVIHQWELVDIINVLKASGAQVIAINDERLVSISEVECAGPTISINHVRYAVPFVIKVIGNKDYIEANLEDPGGLVEQMRLRGIQVSIAKENKIFIPKYRGSNLDIDNISEVGEENEN